VDNALAVQQMKEMLLTAVASLPPDYATVYRMRDLEELSGEEVSQALGISLQAMKSRLHRARAMVRESLDSALGQQVKHS
jgi:RNA polymerase sigma-70 factor (ECF subfamily)